MCKYEYVIISETLKDKYCIIKAEPDNYMHLIGINSLLSAQDFYNKCIDKSLTENDFDFKKKDQSEKSVKGIVRKKISVLPHFCNMFYYTDLKCQQDYCKGNVICSFASASDIFTIGFVDTGRPKTLMKNNQLDNDSSGSIIAVLRKSKGTNEFKEIVLGNTDGYKYIISKLNSK